jgi:hypothetical protein
MDQEQIELVPLTFNKVEYALTPNTKTFCEELIKRVNAIEEWIEEYHEVSWNTHNQLIETVEEILVHLEKGETYVGPTDDETARMIFVDEP